MRLCLSVEGHGQITWQRWKALAETCEATRIDGLFRSDHYDSVVGSGQRGADDAWMILAALAVVTHTIRLGSLVSPVTFRHPSHLAKTVTTADRLSGGRIELGLGIGWHEREHRSYGFSYPAANVRADMLAEQLEVIQRTWTEEQLSFRGDHYQLEDLSARPRPVQRPHPPIIVGGSGGRRTTELAARWAAEYNVAFAGVADARRCRDALDRACEGVGRDPTAVQLSVMTGCIVGSDVADVRSGARRAMAVLGDRGDPRAFLAAKARQQWLVGTVDEVCERARALAEVPVDRLFLKPVVVDDLEMVELLGADVAPRLN